MISSAGYVTDRVGEPGGVATGVLFGVAGTLFGVPGGVSEAAYGDSRSQ